MSGNSLALAEAECQTQPSSCARKLRLGAGRACVRERAASNSWCSADGGGGLGGQFAGQLTGSGASQSTGDVVSGLTLSGQPGKAVDHAAGKLTLTRDPDDT